MSTYVKLGAHEIKQLATSPINRYNSNRSFSGRKSDVSPSNKNGIQGFKHTLPSKVVVHESSLVKNSPSPFSLRQEHSMNKSASATNYLLYGKKEEKNDAHTNGGSGGPSKTGLRIRENMGRFDQNENKVGGNNNLSNFDSRVTV